MEKSKNRADDDKKEREKRDEEQEVYIHPKTCSGKTDPQKTKKSARVFVQREGE